MAWANLLLEGEAAATYFRPAYALTDVQHQHTHTHISVYLSVYAYTQQITTFIGLHYF